ncbi:hypothetical protein F4604DRAFT_1881036 [Suillus subluteus]|nr:hypothetical protein F4604DRAFT_1881036 [Suillus subluteus]
MSNDEGVWGPFKDEEEWQLAKWLIQNVGQNQTDKFLKLPIITCADISYTNNRTGTANIIRVAGDQVDLNGDVMSAELELWRRDPVHCVRELIGNPTFRDVMAYALEHAYEDHEGQSRIYDEMWTCDRWWETQAKLPKGATIAPLILASDKTMYLTIRNIEKTTHQQPRKHAAILIGYLPVAKLDCFSKATCSVAGYRLFHECMHQLLEPLVASRTLKVLTWYVQMGECDEVHPILAAYVADHPEQCLIAFTKGKVCCPVYHPFWADLPFANIFASIMPDILHQLHKGVFHDHLLKWCTEIAGESEIDECYCTMTNYPGLRYFSQGISLVSQWMGTEHREMQCIFMGVLAGAVQPKFHSHTLQSLDALQSALDEFHQNKQIFIDLGVRGDFNIPKLHSMVHYVNSIKSRGSADSFNTEFPERLHIDFAKEAYHATNQKDYVAQMTRWLAHQEAVDQFEAYFDWRLQRDVDDEKNETQSDGGDAEVEVGDVVQHLPNQDVMPLFRILAARPPFHALTVASIAQTFGGLKFMPALTLFLRNASLQNSMTSQPHSSSTAPVVSQWDCFDAYRRLSIPYPNLCPVHMTKSMDRIRTIPFSPALGRSAASPAHFDTNLNAYTRGTGLEGLQVVQVQLLFNIPSHLHISGQPYQVALIEWFTPFCACDGVTKMHSVSQSYSGQAPRTEVIPMSRIMGSCHLLPKFGTSDVLAQLGLKAPALARLQMARAFRNQEPGQSPRERLGPGPAWPEPRPEYENEQANDIDD